MTDENPILRSLLDSLSSFNHRLSIIETTLSASSTSPSLSTTTASHPAPKQGARDGVASSSSGGSGNALAWGAGSSLAPRPPLVSAPSSSSTSSASSPSFAVHVALLPPPANFLATTTIAIPAPTTIPPCHALHRHHKRLRLQDERIKEDGRVEDAYATYPAESDESDEAAPEDRDEDGADEGRKDGIVGDQGDAAAVSRPSGASSTAAADPGGDDRLEALPEGFLVTARATLQEELDDWTLPRGYSMRINGTRSHGRRQKIRMVCFRGGRSRLRPKDEGEPVDANGSGNASGADYFDPNGPARRRQRKPTIDRVSKKCECPFRFELVEVCPGADRYAVHYTNDDHRRHNHAAADLMLDPRARKLPAALKDEVDQWLRGARSVYSGEGEAGANADNDGSSPWTIAKIQAELQRRGYGHVLDFDLRNRKRALLHKERMAAQLKTDSSNAMGNAS